MGYFSTDKPYPRGELLVKTKQTIGGYFNNPTETSKNFTLDGFYRTGDIVQMKEGGKRIEVIDRKSFVFKLSTSEMISPSKVENVLLQSKLCKQIMIHGNSSHSRVLAIVVPSALAVEEFSSVVQNDQVDATEAFSRWLQKQLEEYALSTKQLKRSEVPAAVLIDTEWTIEEGLLTPSSKLKRIAISRRNQKRIDDTLSSHCGGSSSSVDSPISFSSVNTNASPLEQLWTMISSILSDVHHIEGPIPVEIRQKSLIEIGMSSLSIMRIVSCAQEISRPHELSQSDLQTLQTASIDNVFSFLSELTGFALPSTSPQPEVPILQEAEPEPREIVPVAVVEKEEIQSSAEPKKADRAQTFLETLCKDCDSSELERVWQETLSRSQEKVESIDHQKREQKGIEFPVLLTGCPGFFGVHCLKQMLSMDRDDLKDSPFVYCLIRADSEASARFRLVSAFRFFFPASTGPAEDGPETRQLLEMLDSRRIVCVATVSSEGTHLQVQGEGQYEELVVKVKSIVHGASEVNVAKSYQQLRPSNVILTHQLVRLALSVSPPMVFHYVSTLSVTRKTKISVPVPETFDEDRLSTLEALSSQPSPSSSSSSSSDVFNEEEETLEDKLKFYDGYAGSKWVSEALLVKCQRKIKQMAVSIHRPTLLTWPLSDNPDRPSVANPNDWMTLTLSLFNRAHAFLDPIDRNAALNFRGSINILPVDQAVSLFFAQITDFLEGNRADPVVHHVVADTGNVRWRSLLSLIAQVHRDRDGDEKGEPEAISSLAQLKHRSLSHGPPLSDSEKSILKFLDGSPQTFQGNPSAFHNSLKSPFGLWRPDRQYLLSGLSSLLGSSQLH